MVIANVIRECLEKNPDGMYTRDIYLICVRRGLQFRGRNEKDRITSVSGQLSKMAKSEKITYISEDNRYSWKPKK